MAENSNVVDSTEHSAPGASVKNIVEEKDVGTTAPTQPQRVSEWEALQIAAAGDLDTIDREVGEIEADLQRMHIQSTWYKPQLRLSHPKYFTWLLVGMFSTLITHLCSTFCSANQNKYHRLIDANCINVFLNKKCFANRFPTGFASMGGLLSGIDQSLISGANLFMPTCKCSIPPTKPTIF